MSYTPTDLEYETYMRGECHVHAIAAVEAHGGGYAVAYDDSDPYYEDDEDYENDVSSVVHVWSLHNTPEGMVARDVTGDIEATPENLREALLDAFPDLDIEEVRLDMQGTLEEIRELSGNGDRQPLMPIRKKDLARAAKLHSVTSEPGTLMREPDADTPSFT